MKHPATLVVLAVAGLAGCATIKPVELGVQFDAAQAAAMVRPGTAALKGSALMRQQGGGVVTCAGNPVELLPKTEYAARRMAALYPNGEQGFRSANLPLLTFIPNPPEYLEHKHATRCDAQGSFEFERVAAGEYFLITTVVWRTNPYLAEGGHMMRRAVFQDGQRQSLVVAP